MESLSTDHEQFEVHGADVHWLIDGGLMSSAIGLQRLPKVLGQPCTTRNTNSLRKLGRSVALSGRTVSRRTATSAALAVGDELGSHARQRRPAQRQHRARVGATGERGELSGMPDRDAEHIVLGDDLVEEAGLLRAVRIRDQRVGDHHAAGAAC